MSTDNSVEKKVRKKTATPANKPLATKKQMQLGFGDLSMEKQEYVAALTRAKKSLKTQWRGMAAVPPASILESILSEFKAKTNIPLEVPFFTFLHYLSAHLLQKGVHLKLGSTQVSMEFWTIVLASSGGGKTFTHQTLKNNLHADIPEVNGSAAASARQFIEELQNANGKGLWQRDEFLQFLKAIESGGPLAEMKDYLLRIYDGEKIERKTKDSALLVEKPELSILGFNALQPFIDGINPESLLDGFAQRFGYVLAKEDPDRKYGDYALWEIQGDKWAGMWESLSQTILPAYIADQVAIDAFKSCFKDLINGDIPESFYRRILWKAHKYAVIYHIIRGDGRNEKITAEDYGWAARVLHIHLADTAEILSQTNFGELEKLVQQCEKASQKLRDAGKEVTPRTLLQRVKGLQNASTAKFVFEFMKLGNL
jgi:hypothetical protein